MTYGELLKNAMETHNVTYRKLAKITNYCPSYIYQIANDLQVPPVNFAQKVEENFGLKVSNSSNLEYGTVIKFKEGFKKCQTLG